MSENRILIYRHAAWVRLTHWINVVCMTLLLMSGLQIFNAHPALYWGEVSDFDHPAAAIFAEKSEAGARGVTQIAGRRFDTTGVLGFSGQSVRAFPAWATLPSWQDLANGRLWHFFFAWALLINGAVYLAFGVLSRHFRRDLAPTRADLAGIGHAIVEHARLRFPKGEAARRYNVLQKLTYLVVIFVIAPILVLAGLAMSPRIDAGFHGLVDLFGGRQSARTVHFLCAAALLGFVVIHVAMVLLSGVFNNLRSMITGRYAIEGGSDE